MLVAPAVQAHPARSELAEKLALSIQGQVVYDPAPEGYPSPWRTYKHALELTPAAASHRMIVQDDVVVCTNFRAAVDVAVAARPDRLISFFVAGQPHDYAEAVCRACRDGLSWALLDASRWCPTLALVWPVELIPLLLEFVEAQNWPVEFRADDEIIGRFMRHAQITALASAPSLVDHPDELPSLLGRRARGGLDLGRVAACWIGDCDPLTMDWDAGPA